MENTTVKKESDAVSEKLIVALDYDNADEADILVKKLGSLVSVYKVGLEIFLRTKGAIVDRLHAQHKKVFLDLKFHDITNTVVQSCLFAAEQNVFMFNIHCANGEKTMEAVSRMLKERSSKSLCIGVTVLTNLCDQDMKIFYGEHFNTAQTVEAMAKAVKHSGLHGIVCSAHEAAAVKKRFGKDFVTVCPGVRPAEVQKFDNARKEDQSRVMTPYEAVKAGADYLVVGRPVTQSANPEQTVRLILDEICAAVGTETGAGICMKNR